MLLVAGLGLSSCAPLDRTTREWARPSCTPSFDDRGGWLGGDAAFSVEISAVVPGTPDHTRRSLWLFGDSFVARGTERSRRSYPFVHNTVGLSRCDESGRWSIDYAWRIREDAEPRAFFAPDPDSAWVRRVRAESGAPPYYWPFGSFVDGNSVFVTLLRIAAGEPHGAFALPFRIVGVDLARLTPTSGDPRTWPISIRPLSDAADLVPASALVVEGEYVHAFAFLNRSSDRHPRALVRWPRSTLAHESIALADVVETWTGDAGWRHGLRPDEAAILIAEDATEMSVHRDARLGRWVAVESGASAAGGGVRWRSAPRLEGPWSAPRSLVPFPIRDRRPNEDEHVFCYAGKAHPQYATPTTLVVTYVCSLFAPTPEHVEATLARLLERSDLYRPIAVRVPFPSAAGYATAP